MEKSIFETLSPEQMIEIVEMGPDTFFQALKEELKAGVRELKKSREPGRSWQNPKKGGRPLPINESGEIIRTNDAPPKKRQISPEGRARQIAATKKYWAKKRRGKKN